jgi:general secretion pathway protein G
MHRVVRPSRRCLRLPGRAAAAFTLVEVMVVVIVIGVLATLIIPNLFRNVGRAQQNVARQKMATVEQAINMFLNDYGRYPQTLEELITRPADIPQEKWGQPILRARDLEDPWGRAWNYRFPGNNGPFDLYSYGADGQPGGESENADVVNW